MNEQIPRMCRRIKPLPSHSCPPAANPCVLRGAALGAGHQQVGVDAVAVHGTDLEVVQVEELVVVVKAAQSVAFRAEALQAEGALWDYVGGVDEKLREGRECMSVRHPCALQHTNGAGQLWKPDLIDMHVEG